MASSKEKQDPLHHADPRDKDRGGEKEPLYSTRTGHMERTMFVVDLSRLQAEGDTLENALVLYRPEADIKMQQYEQRCSQLVGMALCTMNFTGNYPEFLRMKGIGYAIQPLGDHYLMGLSSRIDEPPASVINHLNNVHNYFQFYYHSPAHVMKSCQNDWEIFNRSMSQIFHYILTYFALDQHSVPVMLNPLPYLNTQHRGKNVPRLYLLASRVLRACQQHQSIIGGCIVHNSKILTSQFEPVLTEKLALVGGGGVELNRLSILEDDIAPNKVWVLEVFLTPDELDSASNSRKDHIAYQAAYSSLDTNPHLTTSALNWRFQVTTSSSAGGNSTNNNSSSSRLRGNWRNRSSAQSKASRNTPPVKVSQIRQSQTTPDLAHCTAATTTQDRDTVDHPMATSTPQSMTASLRSEDNIHINLTSGAVSYSPSSSHRENSPRPPNIDTSDHQTTTGSSSKRQDQQEDLYLDAMEEFDPTLLPPVSPPASSSGSVKGATSPIRIKEPLESRPSTGSTSSDGFATPPPTPSQDKLPTTNPLRLTDALVLPSENSASFKSAYDTSLTSRDVDEPDGGGGDTLTRNTEGRGDGDVGDSGVVDLKDKEIMKIVNTPIAPSLGANPRSIHMLSAAGSTPASRIPAYPTSLRSWKFRSDPVEDSDEESDFVDSSELQEMIAESKRYTETQGPPQKLRDTTPPPLPPRNPPKSTQNALPPTPSLQPPPARNQEGGGAHVGDQDGGGVHVGDLEEGMAPALPPKQGLQQQSSGEVELVEEKEQKGLQVSRTGDSHEATPMPTGSEGGTPTINTSDTVVVNGIDSQGDGTTNCNAAGSNAHAHPTTADLPNGVLSESDQHTMSTTETTKPREGKATTTSTDKVVHSEPQPVVSGHGVTAPSTNHEDPSVNGEDTAAKDGADQTVAATSSNRTASPTEIVSHYHHDHSTVEVRSGGSSVDQEKDVTEPPVIGVGVKDVVEIGDVDVILTDEPQQRDDRNKSVVESREDSVQQSEQVPRKTITVSESLAGVLHEMGLPITDSIGTDMDPPSGTVTPVEMTYNESTMNIVASQVTARLEGEQREGLKSNNSGEYSSATEDIELDSESLLASEGSTASLSKSSTLSGYGVAGRPRSKSWLSKTVKRKQSIAGHDQSLKSMCLYVQLHMNTMVLLLADPGLHKDHTVLNSLWRSLLPQLMELDGGLRGDGGLSKNTGGPKPHNYFVTFSNYDRFCEAHPNTASFQYRHAVRRAHQEYNKDPSLLQLSLSKEHVRVLSQSVHQREVYFQPGRMGNIDALGLHGAIEEYAKVKRSLRQQPIGGPKLMFF